MTKRIGAALVATLLAALLSACLLSPGKFTSSLDLRKDGRFSFTYQGEIYTLALSKFAQGNAQQVFEAAPCYDDDAKKRDCTADEIAEQKKAWEDDRKANADKAKRDAEQAKAFLGGIDPSDPKAAEELAARLRRQAGFRSVVYKGDGLFQVDYAISGRLDHDFVFPTIERFAMANAFVQITRRNDGTVRVDAPGYAAANSGGPFGPMMAAMSDGKDGKNNMPNYPVLDGQFSLTTDGAILANNTDEGPAKDPAGQRLAWTINLRSPAPPTALVKLGN